jgi:hypothetical protein
MRERTMSPPGERFQRGLWHRLALMTRPALKAVPRIAFAGALFAVGGSSTSLTVRSALAQEAPFLGSGQSLDETAQRGAYLAEAGDCVACHTKHDGLQYLTDEDVDAMAVYLKSYPPTRDLRGPRSLPRRSR